MKHTPPELQPRVIALEGGPCGGKTTALSYIAEAAVSANIDLVVLDEVATDFITSKQVDVPRLAKYDRPAFIDLETELLDVITSGIRVAREAAHGKNTMIIADRCDVAAYVRPDEYRQIVRRLGYTAAPHLSLVNTIAYLPSLAHHDPVLYEQMMGTNDARYEDAFTARATCDVNRRTLSMHPGFEVFDDHDFESRLQKVAAAVMRNTDRATA